jgi:hypothetical protein
MKTGQSDEESGEEEDWALYFAYLLSHTSLTKEAIKQSTIPFLKGVINKLPDIVRPNHMCPFLGGGTTETTSKEAYKEAKEAPTVSAIEAFVRGG